MLIQLHLWFPTKSLCLYLISQRVLIDSCCIVRGVLTAFKLLGQLRGCRRLCETTCIPPSVATIDMHPRPDLARVPLGTAWRILLGIPRDIPRITPGEQPPGTGVPPGMPPPSPTHPPPWVPIPGTPRILSGAFGARRVIAVSRDTKPRIPTI